MSFKECVVEIYSEEIPARFQDAAKDQFNDLFLKKAKEFGLAVESSKSLVTPQRLVLKAQVAQLIPEEIIEKRGPKIGAFEKAIQGFCTSAQILQKDLIEKDGYYYAYTKRLEIKAESLLPIIIDAVIQSFSWPKTMRWPGASIAWVRPLRSLFILFNHTPIIHYFECLDLKSVEYVVGHRFLSPLKLFPRTFKDYEEQLHQNFVIVDQEKRKSLIFKKLQEKATEHHLTVISDERLLDEVTGLVEWPNVFIGALDESLFKAPDVVIATSMRFHQKCFAFKKKDGSLAPYFAAVINTIPKDGGASLKEGYEKGMLKARLDDARFFYELDLKTPLKDYLPKLETIVFHEKLGSYGDKIKRMLHTCDYIGNMFSLSSEQKEALKTAVQLSKTDLLTQMVGEFAELQGIMGEIYAKVEGYSGDIAESLCAHYKPQGPTDSVPTSPISASLAFLDRIDTLIGFIGNGILPTGSKDPYALRRAALGLLRIILANQINVDLATCAFVLHKKHYDCGFPLAEKTVALFLEFMHSRLLPYFKDDGYDHSVITACLPSLEKTPHLNPLEISQKIKALSDLLKTEQGDVLVQGYRRAKNIVTAESQKDKKTSYDLCENSLSLSQEKDLLKALKVVEQKWPEDQNPKVICDLLLTLKQPIDSFFDQVLVNDDDHQKRQNRLALLEKVISFFEKFADFKLV